MGIIVLGLDPSLSSYGWAVHDTAGIGESRCVKRGTFKTKSKDLFVSRNMYMRDSLIGLVGDVKPDKTAIEYPVFKETYSEGMYGLFLYSCEALLLTKSDVVFFDNSQVKAHGKRMINRPSGWKMCKDDIKEAAELDTGIKKSKWKKSDESDAYIIALLGSRFWMLLDGSIKEQDLSDYEKKLFLEIKKTSKGKNVGIEQRKGIAYREDSRFFIWGQAQ